MKTNQISFESITEAEAESIISSRYRGDKWWAVFEALKEGPVLVNLGTSPNAVALQGRLRSAAHKRDLKVQLYAAHDGQAVLMRLKS